VTIVDLSELDTFVRDSLFNVRKGIANSRNATQSNPLLGVMVDLPDKIDFEIIVTSGYQSLNRISSSLESRRDEDKVASQNNTATQSSDNELSSSSEAASDSSLGSGNESDNKKGIEAETDNKSVTGAEADKKSGTGTESDKKSGTGTENDNKKGIGTDSDSKKGAGVKTDLNTSKQFERHLESNDRASSTFDEEEGKWGRQGQISTPTWPGTPCSCG